MLWELGEVSPKAAWWWSERTSWREWACGLSQTRPGSTLSSEPRAHTPLGVADGMDSRHGLSGSSVLAFVYLCAWACL